MRLAERVARTDISGIRKVFDLAATLKHPCNLSIGQPDFDVPLDVQEAAIRAIRSKRNSYTQTQGAPDLRRALLAHLGGRYGEKQLLVTSAVSGGLCLAYLALLDPGDEILVPEPYFVMYKQLALMLGARPVFYDTYPDWRIKPDRLAKLITERTKAIVVGSPANPTGAVASAEEFRDLAAVLRNASPAQPIVALADEIYSAFCYDEPFCSFADFYHPTLVLGGFSKSHAMTGWRVGYAAGPEELVQAMTKFQQFTFVCAPAPFQAAAVAALQTDMKNHIDAYRRKRDFIYEGLRQAGYGVVKPGGAFYIFPEAPHGDSRAFVERCLRQELLVIPGEVFSERSSHFRISYAASDETLKRGLDILSRLAAAAS